MRCEICGKDCEDSLMLARHTLRSPGHEKFQSWASTTISQFRSSLKASAASGAQLTKAMNEGWDASR